MDCVGYCVDVRGRRAAAAADDIEPAVLGPLLELRCERFRRLGEAGRQHRIGQPGIRIGADRDVCDPRQFLYERPHLLRAERAVDADAHQLVVGNGVPIRLDGLARKGASAQIGDGEGDHHGHAAASLFEILVDGEECGLGVQRIEDRFQQQDVHAAVQQPARLLAIGTDQLIKGDGPVSGIVNVGRERCRLAGGPEGAGDETHATKLRGHDRVRRGPSIARPRHVQFVRQLLELVIRQRNGGGVERVAFDDVRARFEVLAMDGLDDLGLREAEQVVVALQVLRRILKPVPAKGGLVQCVGLDHGAHRAVENDNALAQQVLKLLRSV